MTKDRERTIRLAIFFGLLAFVTLVGSLTFYWTYANMQVMDCVHQHIPAVDCRYLVTGNH